MSDASPGKTARIRELNDQVRCTGVGGRVVITRGIEALGTEGASQVLVAVARSTSSARTTTPGANTIAPS